jgi:hypothetical protein
VSGDTLLLLLRTRETVVCETPATRATSRLVTTIDDPDLGDHQVSRACQAIKDSDAHERGQSP